MSIRPSRRLFRIICGISALISVWAVVTCAWGQNASDSELAPLIRQLNDPDPLTRATAAGKLGQFGPSARESIPSLITALGDLNLEVRRKSENALGNMGEAAVIPLANALRNPNPNIRYGATEALSQIGPNAQGAAPELVEVLRSDTDRFTRMNSAIALSRIGPRAKNAIPALIEAFKDRESLVSGFAIQGFSNVGPDAVPDLCKALNDDNPIVRRGAASALRWVGPRAKDSTPALILALQDQDIEVRRNTAQAIEVMGKGAETAAPALLRALSDSDFYVRALAADALATVGPGAKIAVPRLTELVRDDHTFVRLHAARALGNISIFLYDSKSFDSLDSLKKAHAAMRTLADPSLGEPMQQVQRTIDYLQLLWKERIIRWLGEHIYVTVGIAIYTLLSTVCLILLWTSPIRLFYLNEAIPNIEVTLPDFLGKVTLSLRSALLTGFFCYHNRVLDAWVARHIDLARKTFAGKVTVRERNVHVPLPVVLNKKTIASLGPSDLRSAFTPNFVCLLISGEGGSGKTSLACFLSKCAMVEDQDERLCKSHMMLPVLIEKGLEITDKDAFLRAIGNQIKALISEANAPNVWLLRHLLKQRRVVVILDGLSEMDEVSRKHLFANGYDIPINAWIITSRTDESLNDVPTVTIKPLRIQGNRLSTFMESYLSLREKRHLFEDEEFFDICRRLSQIVGKREITVLLAKLYAEQAVAKKEQVLDDSLPETIPDLMLSYLNQINRGFVGEIDNQTVHRAAELVAWECLKNTFRPSLAKHRDVVNALGGDSKGLVLLKHLEVRNKIIQIVGAGEDYVRFTLDPLSEYLAALNVVSVWGENKEPWEDFFTKAARQEGAPGSIKGFLIAVRDCCICRGKESKVPDSVTAELEKYMSDSA